MVKEFENFKEQYDDMIKWSTKKVGYVLQEQDNLDLDELYGMATTALKKAMDLSNSAMELVEWQCETLATLQLAEERRAKENYEIKNVLVLMNDKIERLDGKLDNLKKKEVEKK